MFGSQILETVTGVVFMFLSVSLATTAIQELIASFTRLRASTLRAGLKAMMTEGTQGLTLYHSVQGHPLVAASGTAPSYISSQQFTSALLSVLSADTARPNTAASLRSAIASADGPMKTVLVSLWRDGEQDISAFESRLQYWFDTCMDRVSGSYKRYSQYLSLTIGAALAFLFQMNAIGIVILLWSEEPLRKTVNNAMTTYLNSSGSANTQSLDSLVPAFKLFGFSPIWIGHFEFGLTWFVGCAITAIAASLGAPFWFDFLQTFVNLRGTGPAPATKAS